MASATVAAYNHKSEQYPKLTVGEDLSSYQFHAVKLSSGAVVKCSVLGEKMHGVYRGEADTAGYAADVAYSGITRVELGESATQGDDLVVMANAKFGKRTLLSQSKAGVVLSSGVIGNVVPMLIERESSLQQELAEYTIPMTSLRTHDDLAVNLPAAAANDDIGLVTGTPGTNALSLQSVDFGQTTSDEDGAFEFILPPEYEAGQTIKLRAFAGMLVISDDTALLDVECWSDDGDGSVSADICATAEQSINSATFANYDFTITPTGLTGGDRLFIQISFTGNDSATSGANVTCVIYSLKMLLDIK